MESSLTNIIERLDQNPRIALSGFTSEKIQKVRFFSYGSNLNEDDFREEMKNKGYECGLINVDKRTLQGYRRFLNNESTSHGLAFSIHYYKSGSTQGICHDIPIEALDAFLEKEGLYSHQPKYKLITLRLSQESKPVLSLEGIRRTSTSRIDDGQKKKVVKYIDTTIKGATSWKIDTRYLERLKRKMSSAEYTVK
jgi:hypothetical protein